MSFASIPLRGPGPVTPDWWNALKVAGMLLESSSFTFALANNNAVPTAITNLAVDSVLSTSLQSDFEIRQLTGTNETVCRGSLRLFWRALTSTWDFDPPEYAGDDPGITFSVTTTGTVGQVKYTSGNLAGAGYTGIIKFNLEPFGV